MEIPELPKTGNRKGSGFDRTFDPPLFYTADQMREYAKAAVLLERERAARLADKAGESVDRNDAAWTTMGRFELLAAAIREGK